jgi:hypothetical protein
MHGQKQNEPKKKRMKNSQKNKKRKFHRRLVERMTQNFLQKIPSVFRGTIRSFAEQNCIPNSQRVKRTDKALKKNHEAKNKNQNRQRIKKRKI